MLFLKTDAKWQSHFFTSCWHLDPSCVKIVCLISFKQTKTPLMISRWSDSILILMKNVLSQPTRPTKVSPWVLSRLAFALKPCHSSQCGQSQSLGTLLLKAHSRTGALQMLGLSIYSQKGDNISDFLSCNTGSCKPPRYANWKEKLKCPQG